MSGGRRILVVDDDLTILEFVDIALTEEGHSVRTARNGADALRQIPEFGPDVILLDLRMPVMDGWEFLREYRQRPVPQVPVVLFATAGDLVAQAASLGAVGVLSKPFDLNDLLRIVQNPIRS